MEEIKKISLMVIDSLRYDCVGYQPDKKYLEKDHVLGLLETPTIDKIAKESTCFTKCYSTSSLTPQVLASMFTGTTQVNHKIRLNTETGKNILHKNTNTMAEILKEEGFITVFSSESPVHLKSPDLMRGFDHEFSQDDKKLFSFLAKNENEKIFLFCDFEDVHIPYMYSDAPLNKEYNNDFFDEMNILYKQFKLKTPKQPWEYWNNIYKIDDHRKIWLPIYLKGVSKFDKGRFKYFIDEVSRLGFNESKNSLMIITSDHGEGKQFSNKPEGFGHGGEGYEEISRVPLIIKMPNKEHEISDKLVSNIDIHKIILDSVIKEKISDKIKYKIHSINPFYDKREYAWYIFSRRSFHGDKLKSHIHTRIIISDDKKYKLFGNPEFYLNDKSFELNNSDFVESLYDNLLVRPSKIEEIKHHASRLDKGEISKKELHQKFLASPEYIRKKAFSIVNLKNDPFEKEPLSVSRDLKSLQEYSKFLNIMLELEIPEKLFNDESVDSNENSNLDNEEELRAELEKLGYI